MNREECIQKIRHIQKSMYTFIFEDGKSYKFWAEDADKFYYYLDMIAKYLIEDVPKEQESVLDKIRTEIEKAVWEDSIYSFDGSDEVRIPCLDPDDVFEIIDKYRAGK